MRCRGVVKEKERYAGSGATLDSPWSLGKEGQGGIAKSAFTRVCDALWRIPPLLGDSGGLRLRL